MKQAKLFSRRLTAGAWAALFTVAAVWAAPLPDAASGYSSVQRAFLQERFEEAIGLAQSYILQNPASSEVPRVWIWLALSLDKLQQSNEALRELNRLKDRLSSRDVLWPELLYWEGDISRRALNVIRAKVTFQRLLDRYPDSSWAQQAQLGIGLIDLHQQAFESALANFKHVSLKEPSSPAGRDARLFQGVCHLQLKQYKQAQELFEPLLEEIKEPVTIAQAAFYLGESLSGQERFQDSLSAYQRAVEIRQAPQWQAPAYFGLGWANFRLDKCEESVKQFDQFLRSGVAHHQTEAWFAQGSCLIKLGQEDDALSLFERVLVRDRNHPLAAESGLIMADTYRRQGRSALAFDLLHRLLDRRGDAAAQAQIQLRLASLALEAGQPDQAKSIYESLRGSPIAETRQAALSGLGDVQLFLGDLPAAGKSYNEVIRRLPDTPLAHYAAYQLGRIAMQRGAFDDAAAVFQQLAAAASPAIAEDARLALSLTYVNQGEESAASSTLEEIRRQKPQSVAAARAAYYLALIAAGKNNLESAKRLCQETIAKAPHTDEAVDARLLFADLTAQQHSPREAVKWLRQQFKEGRLPQRQRGKIAKRLGDLSRDEGRYAQAQLWYDEAAVLLPTLRAEMVYRIATCYEEGGDVESAMRWYRNVDQAPWQVRGLLALAKLLEREERLQEAAGVYETMVRLGSPESKLADERLEALREELKRLPGSAKEKRE